MLMQPDMLLLELGLGSSARTRTRVRVNIRLALVLGLWLGLGLINILYITSLTQHFLKHGISHHCARARVLC